jgi:two-component system, response regulator
MHERPLVLVAEDDQDDRELIVDAFKAARPTVNLQFVIDGQELLDYLQRGRDDASGSAQSHHPAIILLDLNMPRKNGYEALAELKSDPALRPIPVIVLTTSRDEGDVRTTYELGASSFITKPTDNAELAEALDTLSKYWLRTVELPTENRQ